MGVVDELAALSDEDLQRTLDDLPPGDLTAVAYDWETFARPKQLPPGHAGHACPGCQGNDPADWSVWLTLAGRGGGKTRTGAETIKQWERDGYRRFAFIAETAADGRDVMVEGESGILSVYPPSERPNYEPSKRRITWASGAIATLYSGEKPDQLRGQQHEKAWADEVAKWQYAQDTWDNLEMGMRLGDNPQTIATTTPRPIPLIKTLVADPDCHVTVWPTWENAGNLSQRFIRRMSRKYEGTRLGRQELEAEILEAIPGAIVTLAMIDAARWTKMDDDGKPVLPELHRIVVAVDPAVTSGEDSDETGIIVVGKGVDGDFYILSDRSCRLSPDGWGRRTVEAYYKGDGKLGADAVIAEVNNGGDLVEHVIKTIDQHVTYRAVRASRGKHIRFEPIGALYEQGRVHHVGTFSTLEDQVCGFTPSGYDGGDSPDHADAEVWGISDMIEPDRKFWYRRA